MVNAYRFGVEGLLSEHVISKRFRPAKNSTTWIANQPFAHHTQGGITGRIEPAKDIYMNPCFEPS